MIFSCDVFFCVFKTYIVHVHFRSKIRISKV